MPSTTAPESRNSSSCDRDPGVSRMTIEQRIKRPRFRDLVFTSAGPHTCAALWLNGNPAFDLWITDYGGCDRALLGEAQYAASRTGSKFQNLLAAWKAAPEVFAAYEAVFVLDDDIRLEAAAINRLFEIRREFDLTVLQPAYDPAGKISHAITRARPTARIRFTNFVEVTCPLFRRESLIAFLRHYDPELSGYGIDWWYCEMLGDLPGRLAIVDEVICLNPEDSLKGGREIDRLQDYGARKRAWEAVKRKHGLAGERAGTRTFRTLAAPREVGRYLADARYLLHYCAKRLRALWARAERRVLRGLSRNRSAPRGGPATE